MALQICGLCNCFHLPKIYISQRAVIRNRIDVNGNAVKQPTLSQNSDHNSVPGRCNVRSICYHGDLARLKESLFCDSDNTVLKIHIEINLPKCMSLSPRNMTPVFVQLLHHEFIFFYYYYYCHPV